MENNVNSNGALVRTYAADIEQNYGTQPLLVGVVTRHPFILNGVYTVGGFLLLASGLWTFLFALAYFWRNDYEAMALEFTGNGETGEPQDDSQTVETSAVPVERSEAETTNSVGQGASTDKIASDGTSQNPWDNNPFPTFASPAKSAPSNLKRVGDLTDSQPPKSPPVAPTAYEILVANPYLSRAGFGAQRTGKSYLFAVATLELANRGTKIFHINLASYGEEDARYWQHATRSVRCDLPSLDEYQAQHYIDLAIEVVNEFFATRHAILIFDEIVLTGSLNNQHAEAVAPLLKLTADKMACLSSTGIKRSQAIWTASPDFVAGNCTQDCKALKSLSLCFVAIAPGKSVDWNGNPVKFHQESFENVSRNFSALTYPPRNLKGARICFIDGQWREVGELPSIPEVATVAATSDNSTDDLIVDKLERSYQQRPARTPNRFEELTSTLTQSGQEQLRSFVEWLSKKKGEEVSYDQIKDSWARHAGVSRSKEAVMPFVHFLVYQRLLTRSANNKWLVSDG